MSNRKGRISNLDTFRGICALLVFIYHLIAHIRPDAFMPKDSWQAAVYKFAWTTLQPLSTFAVIGFFVLSGFVITLYVKRDIAPEGKYLEFLIFRFTRFSFVCAPAVLVSVALSYAHQVAYPDLIWSRYNQYDLGVIVASMTGFGYQWNWPGWTLVVEWSFYILICLFGTLSRPTILNLAIAIGCATYLFSTTALTYYTPALILSFFLGAALTTIRDFVSDKGRTLAIAGCVMTVGLLASPKLTTGYEDTLIKSIAMAIFVMAFSAFPAWSGKFAAAFHWLGKISFSLYIWHWPIVEFGNWYIFGTPAVEDYYSMIFILLVYPPVVFVVSYWSYMLFERSYKMTSLRNFVLKDRRVVA